MIEKEINIKYTEFKDFEELETRDRELVEAAIAAMDSAYAIYSHFHVGAAVRMSSGAIVTGSNQENAAYPSGLCAERTAMFAANAHYPDESMLAIAVAGGVDGKLSSNPASPCGACRQVMAQYQTKAGQPMRVLLVACDHVLVFEKVDDLLPMIFNNI